MPHNGIPTVKEHARQFECIARRHNTMVVHSKVSRLIGELEEEG